MSTNATVMQAAAVAMALVATDVLDNMTTRSPDNPKVVAEQVNTTLKAASAVIAALTPA